MIEIIIVIHILRFGHGHFRKPAIHAKGLQARFRSFLIHQIQHLLRELG